MGSEGSESIGDYMVWGCCCLVCWPAVGDHYRMIFSATLTLPHASTNNNQVIRRVHVSERCGRKREQELTATKPECWYCLDWIKHLLLYIYIYIYMMRRRRGDGKGPVSILLLLLLEGRTVSDIIGFYVLSSGSRSPRFRLAIGKARAVYSVVLPYFLRALSLF